MERGRRWRQEPEAWDKIVCAKSDRELQYLQRTDPNDVTGNITTNLFLYFSVLSASRLPVPGRAPAAGPEPPDERVTHDAHNADHDPAVRPCGRWPRGRRAAAAPRPRGPRARLSSPAFSCPGSRPSPGGAGPWRPGEQRPDPGRRRAPSIACACLYQLARPAEPPAGSPAWPGSPPAGFSGYLLIQLARSMRAAWRRFHGDRTRPAPACGWPPPARWPPSPPCSSRPRRRPTLRRDTRQPALAWAADRESVGLRRGMQVALGLVWLLDAALQYPAVHVHQDVSHHDAGAVGTGAARVRVRPGAGARTG